MYHNKRSVGGYCQYSRCFGRQYCNTLSTRSSKYSRYEYTWNMKYTGSICAVILSSQKRSTPG